MSIWTRAGWLGLSLLTIGLDRWTKHWAEGALAPYRPLEVLPSFNLTLMYNEGAAFSLLSDAGGWQRWFFIGLAVAVSLFIVVWLWRLDARKHWQAAGLALILGGALGNLWDRVVLGHVVDFIQVYYDRWYWPAFNIADSAISVGAGILIVDALLEGRGHSARPHAPR
jgi:signal peptidase II